MKMAIFQRKFITKRQIHKNFECVPSFINSKSAESVDERQMRIASTDFTPKYT